MRSQVATRRAALGAAAACVSLLMAACGSGVEFRPGPQTSEAAGPRYEAGDLMVSNGTDTVIIDGDPVKFPTTVTDAAWSHDGSRIGFVDADGNIATARPDGTDLVVYTKAEPPARRSSPTWNGGSIVYTHWTSEGTSQLRHVWHSSPPPDSAAYAFGDMNGVLPGSNAAPSSSRDGRLVYQHDGRDGLEVWVIDSNAREPVAGLWTKGAAAEISADGKKLAFVAPNGQISVKAGLGGSDGAPVQVTFGVDSPSHLAWSPDGERIAFQTPTGVGSVAVDVPAGASTNPVTDLSDTSGVPSFLPPAMDAVYRVDTGDLVAATVAISKHRWPELTDPNQYGPDHAGGATIVDGGDTATLGRSFLQMRQRSLGLVLVTSGTGLDSRVRDELRRALGPVPSNTPTDGRPRVTILGDVPEKVEQDLRALGYRTVRISSDELADPGQLYVPQAVKRALIADLADPLAAALAGNSYGHNVFYSDGGRLSSKITAFLNGVGADADFYTVGPRAAEAVTTAWPNKPKWTVTALPDDPAEFVPPLQSPLSGVVLVDRTAAVDLAIAVALAQSYQYNLIPVDPSAPLPEALRAWLSRGSGQVNQVITVGSGSRMDAAESLVAGVVGGPLGHLTAPPPQPSALD